VTSDFHWSFVEPVAAGDVEASSMGETTKGATVRYKGPGAANGKTFKIFQHATGKVEHVKGEFYWRVEVGETALMTDYVNAPFMLSKEASGSKNSSEVNWSLGTYLTRKEVEKAFDVKNLPIANNIAPNQLFPHKDLLSYSLAPLILLFIVSIFMIPFNGSRKVGDYQFTLPPMANAQAEQIVFSQPFELNANRNVKITATAPTQNSWTSIDVDLVNEQNNAVESVPLDIEFYTGSDSDGPWSEGGIENSAVLSSVPAGRYSMRVAGSWGNWQQPQPVRIVIEQNASRGVNFFCALLLLSIVPLFTFIWYLTFESRRWGESMFS
jgi:hypothetical protein